MKNFLLGIIFLFTYTAFSQVSNYQKEWQEIDELEIEGKVSTANERTRILIENTFQNGDLIDYIKAKVYHYRLYQINHENSEQYILDDLNVAINKTPSPYKNILRNYKAIYLSKFYKLNRWKFKDRSQVLDTTQRNLATWSLPILLDSIKITFKKSLENQELLFNTSNADISEILSRDSFNARYKPSLYDVLSTNVLDFFEDSTFFITEFGDEKFRFSEDQLFSVTPKFYELVINDVSSSALERIKIYQQLEKNHAERNEVKSLIFWKLERLKFSKELLATDVAYKLFFDALEALSKDQTNKRAQAMILYEMANYYYEQAEERGTDEKLKNPDFLKKAIALLDIIASEYATTPTIQNATKLRAHITKPYFKTEIQQFLPSEQSGRALITYKNIDTLYYKTFPVVSNFFEDIKYKDRDDFVKKAASKFSDSLQVILAEPDDYRTHTTEVILKAKPLGNYMVFFYSTDGALNYGMYQVTDLAVSSTVFNFNTVFNVSNRKTGKALKNVQLNIKSDNGDNEIKKFTDSNGEVTVANVSSYYDRSRNYYIKGKDTLISYLNRATINNDKEATEPINAKTIFFLDRAIYRPGQRVYFKGVLLQNKDNITSVVANEFIEIYVDDPNRNEILELRFKTNEFGSFTGSFDLPKSGITGEFKIYAEEDTASNTEFWNEIHEKGNFEYSSKFFSVEEYKRPTFEVAFDTINKSFKLQDSVKISGSAKSYMGAAITNAMVKYEVTREEMIASWWRYSYSNPVIIKTDSVLTRDTGDFEINFIAEAKKEGVTNPFQIYRYSVKANVTDITGETRTATKTVKIGNKNLILSLDVQKSLDLGDTLQMSFSSKNLNDSKVPVSGELRIYQLETPEKNYKARWWEAPEFNLITEEEFRTHFPNEPYLNQLPPEQWPKTSMVYQSSFESDGEFEDKLQISKGWKEGSYLIEVDAKSLNSEGVSKAIFNINNPESNYLNNGQILEVTVVNRENIKTDGYAEIKIKTPYKDLHLKVDAYSNKNAVIRKDLIMVDGTKTIKVSVKNLEEAAFKLVVSGIRDNRVIEFQEIINFKADEKALLIEANTFRNKIQPGIEEKWSFTIKDSDNKIPDAEVLASMYDASLDLFKSSRWNTTTDLESDYGNYPYFRSSYMVNTMNLYANHNPSWGYRPTELYFNQLRSFGFSFGSKNNWFYKNYLQAKKAESGLVLKGNVRGKIIDEKGLVLPGVNVLINNSTTGTQSNLQGEFALDAKVGDVLKFSFIGMKSEEYIVMNESEFVLVLQNDNNQLDEVVPAPQAETSAGGSELNAEMMLQGKVAGVEVLNEVISIRGSSTLNNAKTPLFVVDGKLVTKYDLDSKDIINVEVLNGMEAISLYGTSASSGVVIITTKAGVADLQKVEARKDLDETAFFLPQLKLSEKGMLEFSFTSPEALTRWKLRLLAHTKNWNVGSLQKTIITQKELSVVPNAPRFLREGDTIIFKAKISNLSKGTLTGNAILKLFDAVTMQPIDNAMNNSESLRAFKMNSSKSEVISWKLVVPDTVGAVTYRILAKAGNFTDGEENLLPVLKNRMLVKESIPFFVRAGKTEAYVFKNLKEQHSSTLRNHKFTIEYSSNPAWYAIQSLPYLMNNEHESSEQIFAKIFANSVGNHILNSQPKIAAVFNEWKEDSSLVSNLEKNEDLRSILLQETPWVVDAESETARKKRVAELFDIQKINLELESALAKLVQLQNPSGAFPWFYGGRDNFYITRIILTGFGKLEKLGVALDSKSFINNAIVYLDKEFLRIEKLDTYYRKKDDFYKSNYALSYLYARIYHLKKHPLPKKHQELVTKIIKFQKEEWLQKSLHDKGTLSLVLNAYGEEEAAKKILKSLKESAVRSQDYGMYWKENQSSWSYSRTSVETQAMLIEAFSDVLNDEEAVEEMKIWLLQNKRTTHWNTSKSTTAACYALLMKGKDWLSISDNTVIKVGNKMINPEKLEETNKEAGTGYLKINWSAKKVSKDLGDIQIENNNTTAGYGGAYWQYFEDLDKIKDDSESPLSLEKELYLNLPDNKLRKITSNTPIKTGDLVTVRLVVRSEAAMDFVHLKDMRASGFEPTDVLSEYKYQDGTGYFQSTRDAATHFFFDSLKKGVYVLEYTVRANNAGKFSNGITLLESMYAPEFSAHTKGIRVEIKN